MMIVVVVSVGLLLHVDVVGCVPVVQWIATISAVVCGLKILVHIVIFQ